MPLTDVPHGAPNEGPEMVELLGVPGGFKYRDGESVRPVDIEEVRSFHRGDLDPGLRGDVARLIATNREWASVMATILRETSESEPAEIEANEQGAV